ncbi:TPA: autotransporter outer membrane beta-barrel domain-containing protein [Escherichia coli]|nr:autotransporter outer membrane beta-barrel domain-containing protein [Escherichia coli]HCQ3860524.1 autotransporter outer membrane beta-barrel domain-containing protein [Escherichia coli]
MKNNVKSSSSQDKNIVEYTLQISRSCRKKYRKLNILSSVVSASFIFYAAGTVAGETGTQTANLNGNGLKFELTPSTGLTSNNYKENGKDAWHINAEEGSERYDNIILVKDTISGGDSSECSSGCSYNDIHGRGGDAIVGNNFTLNNSSLISGGNSMGNSLHQQGSGGKGGKGIVGNNIIINNNHVIRGGEGGFGINSDGGDAIFGDNIIIKNTAGEVYGGTGGDGRKDGRNLVDSSNNGIGGKGGDGGDAISGNFLTIINDADSIISGLGGGIGSPGGNGGDGIHATNSIIENNGSIGAGVGGQGIAGASDRTGGKGGNGISGNKLTVKNLDYGYISGGRGGIGLKPVTGGYGITGSDLNIFNSGIIHGGGKGGQQEGLEDALHFVSGHNTLTLNESSFSDPEYPSNFIFGNIRIEDSDENTPSFLTIQNNTNLDSENVRGDLISGQNNTVSLYGNTLKISGDSRFDDNSTLNLTKLSGVTTAGLHADGKIIFSETAKVNLVSEISEWKQNSYELLSAGKGITGLNINNVNDKNLLLNEGANDYAKVYLTDPNRLIYGLAWNDPNGHGHGEFNIMEGKNLTLDVALVDNTNKAHSTDWDGKSLIKSGKGSLTLSTQNTYSGETLVNDGTLKVAVEDAFINTSGITINEGAILNLSGLSQTAKSIVNSGIILINDPGAVTLSSPVTVIGNMILEKTGMIVLNNNTSNTGQKWIQNGNWYGNGGTVSMGAVLSGDASKTDHLEIAGHASGTTYVTVANVNGTGAKTLEGIKLISTGTSDKDAFIQKGRIVAGAYDYKLQQGTNTGENTNNWYLTSYLSNTPLPTPVPGTPGSENIHIWRPEAGSYIANQMAANTMFNSTINDRHGSVLVDPITNKYYETTMWSRVVGGHNENHLTDGQSKTTANRIVYQLGGEILTTSFSGDDALHLGVMGGYGHQNSKTINQYNGYNSRGIISGYTAGIYGTWFQHEDTRIGLYTDSWIQYGWFNNTVKGLHLNDEKYSSKGITASLGTGYTYPVHSWISVNGVSNTIYLRPQAQVSWFGVKAKNHIEHNGTVVKPAGNDNIQTKLGLRVSMIGQNSLDKGTLRKFEPFAEVNWIRNTEQYGVAMGDSSNHLNGNRNVAELKVGVEGHVTERLGIWGNISQQLGSNSYSDTQGMMGVKYTF